MKLPFPGRGVSCNDLLGRLGFMPRLYANFAIWSALKPYDVYPPVPYAPDSVIIHLGTAMIDKNLYYRVNSHYVRCNEYTRRRL